MTASLFGELQQKCHEHCQTAVVVGRNYKLDDTAAVTTSRATSRPRALHPCRAKQRSAMVAPEVNGTASRPD